MVTSLSDLAPFHPRPTSQVLGCGMPRLSGLVPDSTSGTPCRLSSSRTPCHSPVPFLENMWSCEASNQTSKPIVLSGRSERTPHAERSPGGSAPKTHASPASSCKLPTSVDRDLLSAYTATEQQQRRKYADALRRLDRLQSHAHSESKHDRHREPGTPRWSGRRLMLSLVEPPQWFEEDVSVGVQLKTVKDRDLSVKYRSSERASTAQHRCHRVRLSASRRDLKSRHAESVCKYGTTLSREEEEEGYNEAALHDENRCRSRAARKSDKKAILGSNVQDMNVSLCLVKSSSSRPATAVPVYTRPMASLSRDRQRCQSRQ